MVDKNEVEKRAAEAEESLSRVPFGTWGKKEQVEHPAHYTSTVPGLEAIDITQHFNFNRGNAIKYIWRAGLCCPHTEEEDLQKAIQYLKFEIERLKKW